MSERDASSPLADPALRLLAQVVDLVAPFAPAMLFVPVGAALEIGALVRGGVLATVVASVVLFVLNLVWLHQHGATLGKRIVGLRIVRSDGSRATLGRLFVRRALIPGLIGAIPLVGALFSLADALCVFTGTRQTLHDHLADTIVIDVRRRAPGDAKGVARVFE